MSSIACFYRLSRADLATEVIEELVAQAVDHGESYRWSGHVMMALLDYLDELGLGLGLDLEVTLTDESPSCAFLTRADLEAVEDLDADQVAVSVAEFDDVELDDELHDATVDSIETLRRLVADLTDVEVLVVAIA